MIQKRYIVDKKNPFFISYTQWFDEMWERSFVASNELNWVKKNIKKTKAVFIDRDNTIIKDICYFGNSNQVEIEILPTVIEGLRMILNKGYRIIVVSNQQSVGLKVNSEKELAILTKKIKGQFESYGIYFDAFYYCKHSIAQECNCRKPKYQLFEIATKDFCLNLNECYFIGDSEADRGVGSYLPQLKIFILDRNNNFLSFAKQICDHS